MCWELYFSWFFKKHTPECNEVKAWSKTWREVKWSRTKHLETAKNRSLKVLSITTGEQGQFAQFLPGNVTVINDGYLNNCLFCHGRTPMWHLTELLFLICVFFWFWWLNVFSYTCNGYAGEQIQTVDSFLFYIYTVYISNLKLFHHTLLMDNSSMLICWVNSFKGFIKKFNWTN